MSAIKKEGNYLFRKMTNEEIMRCYAYTDLSNVNDETILNKLKNVDGEGSGLDTDLIRGLPADFSCYKGDNGWMKFPNGMIIQWGKNYVSGNAASNVTFPIQFPHAVFSVVTVPIGSGSGGGKEDYWGIGNVTTSGFTQFQQYDGGHDFYWVAIGY